MNLTEIAKRYMELKVVLADADKEMKRLRKDAEDIVGANVVDVQLSETKNARIRTKTRHGNSLKNAEQLKRLHADIFDTYVTPWTASYVEIREVRR